MHNVQIKHTVYTSSTPGKTLIITGAVHGDEHCGNKALNRLINSLDNGEISLTSGKLILVPMCNPRAYAENTRFIDRNLNRFLFPKDNPVHYEDFIDPILCDLIEQAEFLLDLHSYASKGGPFIFINSNKKEDTEFARNLGVNDFVYGWAEAYEKNNNQDKNKEGMGTTEYARSKGILAAVTLECGQHLNADAPDVGYQAALRAMNHCGLLNFSPSTQKHEAKKQRLVKMSDVFYRKEGDSLSKEYQHFDPVSQGDVIASDTNGKPIYTAPCDGHIILPKHDAAIGSEWFYFGSSDDFI